MTSINKKQYKQRYSFEGLDLGTFFFFFLLYLFFIYLFFIADVWLLCTLAARVRERTIRVRKERVRGRERYSETYN